MNMTETFPMIDRGFNIAGLIFQDQPIFGGRLQRAFDFHAIQDPYQRPLPERREQTSQKGCRLLSEWWIIIVGNEEASPRMTPTGMIYSATG